MKTAQALFSDRFSRELLSRLQADCAALLGGTANMYRPDGSTLIDLTISSPYCLQVASHDAGRSLCIQSRRDLALEAIQTGQPQEAFCHAGVRMIAAPLMVSGEAVAATVLSLVPFPEQRNSLFETASRLELPPAALVDAARKTPALHAEKIKTAVRLLEDLHRLYGLQLAAALESARAEEDAAQSGRRLKALYSATRAISSTLSLDQTVGILVEQMAITAGMDRCLLALRSNDAHEGDALKPAGAYGLTAAEGMSFYAQPQIDLGMRDEWRDRLERGRVVFLPYGWLNKTPLKSFLAAPEGRRGLLVPVTSGGSLWAVAYLDGTRDAESLTQQEIDLALAIAGQAGIALANITRFRQEQRVARTLQESLLSPIPPAQSGFSLGSLYLPALSEAQVGGDFFDLIPVDEDRFVALFGDVSGKGIEAAVHTGMMKYMARALIVEDPAPSSLATRLNRAVAAQGGLESGFITFCCLLADAKAGRIALVNAGHEPPLLYHASAGEAREIPPTGPAIGLLEEFDYPQEERALAAGDCLLLYTDGSVEARSPDGGFFGTEELKKAYAQAAKKDGEGIVRSIHQTILKFTGGVLQDDLALLAIKQP